MVSIVKIRYFIATADAGKVSLAAGNLNVSQSAITAAVKGWKRCGGASFSSVVRTGVSSLTTAINSARAAVNGATHANGR